MNIIADIFCKRYGHRPKTQGRWVWQESEHDLDILYMRYVAVKVQQERQRCGRCGRGQTEWKDTGKREGFTGASFPDDMWRRIRAGKVVLA